MEIKPLNDNEMKAVRRIFKNQDLEFTRFGRKGFLLPSRFEKLAGDIYSMQLRPDDIFVVTFPRSGTTWTQELVWLVANNLDYAKAKSIPLTERYAFLEQNMFMTEMGEKEMREKFAGNAEMLKIVDNLNVAATVVLAKTPSPRFVKSHLPLSLLPPSLLDTTKVVYVARDPRDVIVSYYYFTKSNDVVSMSADFKEYFNFFITDMVDWSPFFEHLKEAWQKRNHPNLLFLFYEELTKDLNGTVRRVAKFLGKQYNDDQLAELCEHLHFDNFKKNTAVDLEDLKKIGVFKNDKSTFIRKGKSGGWRDHFDEELQDRVQRWIDDNLRDTDLRFPTTNLLKTKYNKYIQ